jgi:hypothetical protein
MVIIVIIEAKIMTCLRCVSGSGEFIREIDTEVATAINNT